jgi:hypothetical protein
MTEYEEGDTFRHEEREQHWKIVGIDRTYRVQVLDLNKDDPTEGAETMTVPGETIDKNLEWETLERVTHTDEEPDESEEDEEAESATESESDPGDEEEEDGFQCDECDVVTETARGLKSHKAQVHD